MFRRAFAPFVLLFGACQPIAAQPHSFQVPSRPSLKPPTAAARLDGTLMRLVASLPQREAVAIAAEAPRAVGDKVLVTIRFAAGGHNPVDVLRSLDLAPVTADRDVVEAYVPLGKLVALGSHSAVRVVEATIPPQPQAVSQAVTVHNASAWHAAGHTGAGVKVGIIDLGFMGIRALQGTELPGTITGRCYAEAGPYTANLVECDRETAHGTAVAEALVDIAPGVDLFIANPYTPLQLQQTVDWMLSQGVRVINHSVCWTWSGPGDGTSPFPDSPLVSVDLAAAAGVLWTNAAGNYAASNWTGTFSDVNGDSYLEFSGSDWTNAVTLQAGTRFIAQARWEDSWTNAARDLDSHLLDGSGAIVAWSAAPQTSTADQVPREILSFVPARSGTYHLAIRRQAGAFPAWVDLQAFTQDALEYSRPWNSICNPAESASPALLAVGAAPWSSPESLEWFSSEGPTRDGRVKPDVVGVDRGDSLTYGAGGFGGTSQASPHVAGLAALVLESFPETPAANVVQYIRATASPRGAPNSWGAGLAHLPNWSVTLTKPTLVSTGSSPAARGEAITWAAFAMAGADPIEYRYWLYDGRTGWSILQDYSPSNVLHWTPNAEGTYALQVWVRRVGTTAAYEGWQGTGNFTVGPPPSIRVVSITPDRELPVWFNTPITWAATATGGLRPLQYKYWLYREGVGWSMVRDYSPDNTYSWTPAERGRYALQVWVRGAESATEYDAWQGTGMFQILGVPPVAVTELSQSAASPSSAGVPITWTAYGTGGAHDLRYRFWRLKHGGGWTMVQDYGPSNTYTWTPAIADTGSYSLQVWVRQLGSTAEYEAWRGIDFTVKSPPPVRVTTLQASVDFPVLVGRPITWSATATGGALPLQYRFWLYAGGSWSVLQDYSPSSSVKYTPGAPGEYAIQVWVRSSTSILPYEDWRGSGYWTANASPLPVMYELTADTQFPARVLRTITWTAHATGGQAPLEYRFWRYKQGIGWSIVQDYGVANTYSWTPDVTDPGVYAVQAWVRRGGSSAEYEGWQAFGEFELLTTNVLLMTSDAGDNVGVGLGYLYTSDNAIFTPIRYADGGVGFSVATWASQHYWGVHMGAAPDVPLSPGVYENAIRYGYRPPSVPGLDIWADGRGCELLSARFIVLEADYDVDGSVLRFAADFEPHCNGSAAALYGSIRYNSTAPLTLTGSLLSTGTTPPVQVGTPLTWTASPSSGREFRMWRYREATRSWEPLQDYSPNPTFTWTPQPGDEGNWSIIMWERAVGSPNLYESWRTSGSVTIVP